MGLDALQSRSSDNTLANVEIYDQRDKGVAGQEIAPSDKSVNL